MTPLLASPDNEDPTGYDPEAQLRKSARWAFIAIAVLLLGFGLSAALIPIGGAVMGSGQLGAESRIKRIAHPVGGVISAIMVKDGDRVRKGQILMRLDSTVTGATADLSGRSVNQLLAQQARLTAERDGLGAIPFPDRLAKNPSADARAAMESEQRQFELRRHERASLRSQLYERVRQLQQQIGGYTAQIAALEKQKRLIQPEREGVRSLWEQNLVTINRLNQLERTAVDMDGSVASLRATIAQTGARIAETREQMLAVDSSARSDAAEQLAQVNAQLNEEQVRNIGADDVYDRSVIRAPYDGIVDKLAFATIGDVVKPAETIMEIVPTGDQLVVEAMISPNDIDQVKVGQTARISLSAFNRQTTPEIPGRVSFVSAERATLPDSQASFYRVWVALDASAVRKARLRLKSGMPAEVFIATGSRSMLSYLVKPLKDQLSRSFRND